MPSSANHTSPGCILVGAKGLSPRVALLFRSQKRWWMSSDLERKRLAEFDLGEEHVNGIPRLHAETLQNLFCIAQPRGRDTGSEKRGGWRSHAQKCAK